ncbi:hypothetical protein Xvie_02225 [Xenorhabdus vietnamensis]|uniref:Uncharacterized protein n=1 Tax=Xenorhabdus vietnamensis TaxID=351656 RepID=A0A1Y2SBY9_9GAMM|nr:hypothetical protein Xvie_02225 [Xenorhabdus vietnamensis]
MKYLSGDKITRSRPIRQEMNECPSKILGRVKNINDKLATN